MTETFYTLIYHKIFELIRPHHYLKSQFETRLKYLAIDSQTTYYSNLIIIDFQCAELHFSTIQRIIMIILLTKLYYNEISYRGESKDFIMWRFSEVKIQKRLFKLNQIFFTFSIIWFLWLSIWLERTSLDWTLTQQYAHFMWESRSWDFKWARRCAGRV